MSFNFNLLRMFRAREDLTQPEVAKKMNTSTNIYWAMENGKRINQINHLISFIKAFNLSDEEILKLIKGE